MGDAAMAPAEQPRAALSRGRTGRGFWWAVTICLLLVVVSAIVGVILPDRAALLTIRLIMILCLLLGGVTCVMTGLRRGGADRVWRLLIAVMLLAICAASAATFLDTVAGAPPVPRQTPVSLVYLVPQAFGLAGVLRYPSDPLDGSSREPGRGRDYHWYVITILDGLIVVGAVMLLAWIAVLEEAVEGKGPLAAGPIYSIILAAASLVVTVAVFLVAVFRQPRPGLGLELGLLTLGLLTVTVSIICYMAVVVRGLRDVPRLVDLLLLVGPLFIGLAALSPDTSQSTRNAGPDADRSFVPARRRWWHAVLPYLPLTAAGIATVVETSGEDIARQEEVWAMLALLLIALVRQMVTMADNIRLLSQVEEKQHELRYQAFHDPLTGLANRTLFIDRLALALRHRDQPDRRLAVLFCDLDNFKRVNDAVGHAAGDDLLRITARRLVNNVRPSDTVARLGGDEFAILLDPAVEDPEMVGRRLAASVRAPIDLEGTTYTIATSTGLVVVDPASEPPTAETLLHRADLAMYAAKARRTGDPTAYTPDLAPGRPTP